MARCACQSTTKTAGGRVIMPRQQRRTQDERSPTHTLAVNSKLTITLSHSQSPKTAKTQKRQKLQSRKVAKSQSREVSRSRSAIAKVDGADVQTSNTCRQQIINERCLSRSFCSCGSFGWCECTLWWLFGCCDVLMF